MQLHWYLQIAERWRRALAVQHVQVCSMHPVSAAECFQSSCLLWVDPRDLCLLHVVMKHMR